MTAFRRLLVHRLFTALLRGPASTNDLARAIGRPTPSTRVLLAGMRDEGLVEVVQPRKARGIFGSHPAVWAVTRARLRLPEGPASDVLGALRESGPSTVAALVERSGWGERVVGRALQSLTRHRLVRRGEQHQTGRPGAQPWLWVAR